MLWPFARARRNDPVHVPEPCFVIGDVHGHFDLLQRLVAKAPQGAEVICVGDYVDRGEDSAGVLRWLQERPEITCLIGNHELMMLAFLDDPTGSAARWLDFGGHQTLVSFGLTDSAVAKDAEALQQLADGLRTAMGPALIDWLRGLPSHVVRGNVLITHAGANPHLPVDGQPDDVLAWGHADFRRVARTDGMWVLHGHTIANIPEVRDGVISIDTGVYATGRLTAAILDTDGCRFVGVDQAET